MFRGGPVARRVFIGAAAASAVVGAYALSEVRPTTLLETKAKANKKRPGPLWAPMTRAEMLAHLRTSGVFIKRTAEGGPEPELVEDVSYVPKEGDDVFDLLIVGGGATGSGTAVDAASRGLKVALVERDDFSSGTSSKSTKLVHGGVRYLQKAVMELDYEQYKLVKEALHERKIFLETAPYLSKPLPILLPIYTWWQLPYYYAGCKMYDLLAGGENMEGAYWMGKNRALEAFPMLNPQNLVGGVVYYDGQHNDSRMNISLISTAVQQGAIVANQTDVVKLHKKPDPKHGGEDRIYAATVRDRMTGDEYTIRARGVINATGPFSDGLRKLDEPTTQDIVAPSSGVHITLPVSDSVQNLRRCRWVPRVAARPLGPAVSRPASSGADGRCRACASLGRPIGSPATVTQRFWHYRAASGNLIQLSCRRTQLTSRTTTAPTRWVSSTRRPLTAVSSSSSRGRATLSRARPTRPRRSRRTRFRRSTRSSGS